MRPGSLPFLLDILVILAVLSLAGCRAGRPGNVLSTPDAILSPTVSPSLPSPPVDIRPPDPAITAPPSPTPFPTLTQYRLTAVLNYDTHRLGVDEVIHYVNNTSQTLDELPLMVDALYYPGVFELKSIRIENSADDLNLTIDVGHLRLSLPAQLSPGEEISLVLSYDLTLPSPVASAETRPVPFGYTSLQTNLVDWYPYIPPHHPSNGWLINRAGFFGEHLVYDIADFEVHLRVESLLPRLEVAASATGQKDDQGWIHYTHPKARNFVFSVSPEYEVLTATIDGVTINSYSFPFQNAAAQAALDATVKSIELYNRLYPSYPRQLLSLVEADFLDGMEYDGLYFLSKGFYNLYQGSPDQYLIAIAAHETAHQWFYGMAGNDQALEPWLDEALCTFHELVFYEQFYPEALDWWWSFRIKYYDPAGWVDSSIYNSPGYRAYRDAVYLNGAVFLDELRTAMGNEQFSAFLRNYLQLYAGKIATSQDFFTLAENYGIPSRADIYDRFFYNHTQD